MSKSRPNTEKKRNIDFFFVKLKQLQFKKQKTTTKLKFLLHEKPNNLAEERTNERRGGKYRDIYLVIKLIERKKEICASV